MTLISTLRGILIRPPAGSIGGVQGSNTWSVTHTGFFVATNIKIQQSIGCVSTRVCGLLVSLFLVEEENNVGNVAQSEKFPENSQYKSLKNAYTDYTAFGLER